MKPQPDQSDSTLTETMSAKIDIEDLNDPALGKAIIDAVSTIEGVLEAKIEKGALYVCYDPLVTNGKEDRERCPLEWRHGEESGNGDDSSQMSS
jgi:hypothetical protein